MTKKLVNFRIDSTLWENYQSYCKSINITATESIINHINSTLSDGKDCKDNCKDDNDNVKTEYKDIESIKTQLFNQQINIDNQIILLTQRIDKLTNDNNSLKQDNIDLTNEIELIKKNQDKLIEKVENLKQDNATLMLQLTELETHSIFSESGKFQEVAPPVETINYSSLTVAQLKNKLDQLGIKYRKKANKSELINLLS